MIFITRVCRMLSLLSTALLVVLSGCGDGNPVDGGVGGIVGDWLAYSTETHGVSGIDDGTTIFGEDYPTRIVHSYKSTGEYSFSLFQKTNGVWTVLAYDYSKGYTWRTEDSKLIESSADTVWIRPYSVSNGKLVLGPYTNGGGVITATFKKVRLADYRRSLGL